MELANLTKRQLISKIKKLEQEIGESKEKTELTFEYSAVGLAHISGKGELIRVNKKYAQMFGYLSKKT